MNKTYKVGYIAGMFDILHAGHIHILKYAKSQCDHLIVAVGTDEFMLTRKGRNSIMPYEERVEIIKAIRYVDQVVPETNLNKIGEYNKYHFNVMFSGDDHIYEETYIRTTDELKKLGVDTIFIPRVKNLSSTNIRENILRNNFDQTNK